MNEIKCPKCGEIFQADENYYAETVKQVKDKEFSKELKTKELQFEKDKNNFIQLTKLELEKEFAKELSSKDAEINKLKSEIKSEQISKKSEINEIISKKDKEVTELKNKLNSFNKDKDRKDMNCEYAVLVSLLEQENELYNSGIVDMPHKYNKMYVIRPQFFIPIITLLRNASLNSLEYRKELSLVKAQNIDISNFKILV